MKTVNCAICGQEVSRRKTLAIDGNKRACREHTETEIEATTNQKNIEQRHQKGRSKPKREKEHFDCKARCFVCGEEGIKQREYFFSILKNSEKFKLTYGRYPNPFSNEDMLKANSALKGKRCLFIREFDPKAHKKIRFQSSSWQAVQILGAFLICTECGQKHELELFPEVSWEQLKNSAVAYELLLKPLIEHEAGKEISEVN